MTVEELLKRITSKELSEWQAFYNIEPFGEERMDLRFALMTANLLAPHVKKGSRLNVKDFLLTFKEKKPMSDELMQQILKGSARGSSR